MFQAELAEARTQLQLLQKQLDEQLDRQPAGNQEVTLRGASRLQWTGLTDHSRARPFIPCVLGKGYLLFLSDINT